MTVEEEARLTQHVMEDSMNTHDERQWPGLEETMALSAAGDVAIPEPKEEEPGEEEEDMAQMDMEEPEQLPGFNMDQAEAEFAVA